MHPAEFLDGAAEEDKLSANPDMRKNPEMLDALIGIYERNVLGYPCTAVLPYSQALSRFPAHHVQSFFIFPCHKDRPFLITKTF